jgi:DNA polymerase IV
VRLIGVSLAGLTDDPPPALFEPHTPPAVVEGEESVGERDRRGDGERAWRPGDDVRHDAYGHGWVQGAGHGRVTVRFETRSTGPGRARTFAADDPDLSRADPLASLD